MEAMHDAELSRVAATLTPERFGRTYADVVFDQQDSGCVSWGVTVAGRRWFVKQATTASARSSLENCLRFHTTVRYAAIVRPVRRLDADDLTLLYPWVPGTVLDAHRAIAAHGFVAVDFYDGCVLYDFDERAVKLIDLDEYRPGPFVLDQDRLPGSTSYMAPEEFERGATIDQRTTVFNLGRLIEHVLHSREFWRGTAMQANIGQRATTGAPTDRFQTIDELHDSWSRTHSA